KAALLAAQCREAAASADLPPAPAWKVGRRELAEVECRPPHAATSFAIDLRPCWGHDAGAAVGVPGGAAVDEDVSVGRSPEIGVQAGGRPVLRREASGILKYAAVVRMSRSRRTACPTGVRSARAMSPTNSTRWWSCFVMPSALRKNWTAPASEIGTSVRV